MTERHANESGTGLGADDLEREVQGRPDFDRGAGGEPLVTMPDGKRERYARMSSIGDTLEDRSGLNNWLVSKAMEGVASDDALVAQVKAVSPYEEFRSDWTELREKAISAGRGHRKADIGTAVHAMSERFETDPQYDPGPPYTAALEAYERNLRALGLKSQMFEVQFVNDHLRAAGTADRVYELTEALVAPDGTVLPAGSLVIGDLKTSAKTNSYNMPTFSCQLAGYAGGTLYDVEANRRLPTPTIRQDWGIIAHILVEEGTAEFLWVDLEVGRFGSRMANEVREWRRAWRRKSGYSASVLPVRLADPDLIAVVAEDPDPDPEPEPEPPAVDDLEAWRDHHRARLEVIRSLDEAKDWMLVRWPADLAPPKRLRSLEESAELDEFLARVEAEFQLPFVEGRPVSTERKASA